MMTIRFLILAGLLAILAGCKKEDNGGPEETDPFLGKWEIVAATGSFADDNKGTVYEFKSDGSLKITKGISSTGTFVKTDSEITFTISGIDLMYSYTMSGETMFWQNLSSTDQTFELEKR